MAKRLTSMILLLVLASGSLAGTPIFSGGDQRAMSEMACCKMQQMETRPTSAARLCRVLNCSESAPTSSNVTVNVSASAYTVSDSIRSQIASLLENAKPVQGLSSAAVERKVFRPALQLKYIQHHSFLI